MELNEVEKLSARLAQALAAREARLDLRQGEPLRLFNGFYEGCPELVADLYGRTLVLFGYAEAPARNTALLDFAQATILGRLPWVECVIQKRRGAAASQERRGIVTFGGPPAQEAREGGVRYALDLQMNQDASFYLDTRGLRRWLVEQAQGWEVLNLFAYTGSLGVAAAAGGAARVVQADRNRKFLELARRSLALNGLDPQRMELRGGDFFDLAAAYKRSGRLFDCVILDPPYFSTTSKGTVDLGQESARLINKVRPLVRDGGRLVAINNALFLSGQEYLAVLESLGRDGYLEVEALLPAPEDLTGYPGTVASPPPRDPAPFNHPTKIAVLRIRRKK